MVDLPVIDMKMRMEAFSRAFAHAIAAAAGVAVGSITPDINSLDVHFLSPDDGANAGTCSHVQLKSTAKVLAIQDDGAKQYLLRHQDYDRLRMLTRIPRVLVVLEVPADADSWLTCSPDELVMHASARWINLRGAPETTYAPSSGIPVDLPKSNIFTPDALRANMGSLDDA